jgi:hypothetical protein
MAQKNFAEKFRRKNFAEKISQKNFAEKDRVKMAQEIVVSQHELVEKWIERQCVISLTWVQTSSRPNFFNK